MRLVGYVRVSRVGGREGPSFISPDVQQERIAAQAKAKGAEIVAWETDLDQTGATMERPGLQAALERIRKDEAEGIIVLRLNRFARSTIEASQTLHELEAMG